MSLASASESCTNIGVPRRASSAAVSSSQLSIARERTGPVEIEEGDLQRDPVPDLDWGLTREEPMRIFTPLFVAVLVGCGAGSPAATQTSSSDLKHQDDASSGPNPMLYPKTAQPYGQPMYRWAELMWSYIYSIAPDQNPFFDTSGEFCAVNQDGPDWFLPAVP